MGLPVFDGTPSALVRRMERALEERVALRVSFFNPHSICLARKDPRYRADLAALDILGVDGIGIVWASWLLGTPVARRLSADLVAPELFRMLVRRRTRMYLLGGHPGVAEYAARRLQTAHPGLQIVRWRHGYFSPSEAEAVLADIDKCRAEIVLVGLGAPFQERWIVEHSAKLESVVWMTCGGFFDQVVRRYPYYPRWAYQFRMNWLYRLVHDPRRLWRRYTLEMLEFLWLVLRNHNLQSPGAGERARRAAGC